MVLPSLLKEGDCALPRHRELEPHPGLEQLAKGTKESIDKKLKVNLASNEVLAELELLVSGGVGALAEVEKRKRIGACQDRNSSQILPESIRDVKHFENFLEKFPGLKSKPPRGLPLLVKATASGLT